MWGMGAAALFWAIVQPWWGFPFGALRRLAAAVRGGAGPLVPVAGLATWMIVLGTVVPFSLVVVSMQHLRASQASAVGMTEPIFATAIAWLALGEAMEPVQLLGAGIVLGSVLVAELEPLAAPALGDRDLDRAVDHANRVVAQPADAGEGLRASALRPGRVLLRAPCRSGPPRPARSGRRGRGRRSSASAPPRPYARSKRPRWSGHPTTHPSSPPIDSGASMCGQRSSVATMPRSVWASRRSSSPNGSPAAARPAAGPRPTGAPRSASSETPEATQLRRERRDPGFGVGRCTHRADPSPNSRRPRAAVPLRGRRRRRGGCDVSR